MSNEPPKKKSDVEQKRNIYFVNELKTKQFLFMMNQQQINENK